MPVPASKRNYDHERALEKKKPGAFEARMERQRARRALDKKGIDRKGKDVAHVKSLAKGGSNSSGVFLEDAKSNRTYARDGSSKPKSRTDKGAKGKRIFKV